jgi:hypothetical protein
MESDQSVPVPWQIEREGRRWYIRPLTDAAGLLMQEVRTPATFGRKADAEAWLHGSLASHGLALDEDGRDVRQAR